MAAAGAQPCRLQRRGAGMRRLEPQSGASLPAAGWRPGAPLASLALAFLPYGAAASSSPVLRHLRLQGSGMPLSPGSGRRGPRPFCSAASPSLSASVEPTSPKRKRTSVEGDGKRPRSAGAPRRPRTPEEVWRTGRVRLRCPGAERAELGVQCCVGLALCAASVPRGSGGCSDLTAAWIRRGRAM